MVNLKKMAEMKNFDGLAEILKTGKFKNRVKVMETLMEMNDPIAKETIKKVFTYLFEYGDKFDKIEAITIMQGHFPNNASSIIFSFEDTNISDNRWKVLQKIPKIKFKKKMDLYIAKPILLKLAKDSSENDALRWYAIIALIEIGERNNDTLQLLLDLYPKVVNMFNAQTNIRTFSYFHNPEVIDFFIKILKGEMDYNSSDAICALAATGEPRAKEYLEFYGSNKAIDKISRNYAKNALKLFGENFDLIHSKIIFT